MSILSEDLSNVPTGMPLLPPGKYEVSVTNITTAPNKAGTGDVMTIELALNQSAQSTEGEPINVGFPLYDRISLVPTEKYDPRKSLAAFREAVTGSKAGAFGTFDQYIGKVVLVKLKIESDRNGQYPDSNRIVAYMKAV